MIEETHFTLEPAASPVHTSAISRMNLDVAGHAQGIAVIPVSEVNLARVPRALEGEVRGVSSLEGAVKGRLWRKGSSKEVYGGAQRVNAHLSHLSCL
jgi:hypothetical protein